MDWLLRDFRIGFRRLIKNPGLTLAVVLCIALGIGANSAVFSFAYALLFKKSPAREPERLIRIFASWEDGLKYASFSYPDFTDVREHCDVFSGLVAQSISPFHLSVADSTERVWGLTVTGNYFRELGVAPVLGRGFLPEEDSTEGTHPVAVISHGLWQRRFGSDAGIIGGTVRLNSLVFTVVGVAPEGFYGIDSGIGAELWVPMAMREQLYPGPKWLTSRGHRWINGVIGRLKPGVGIEQASAAVNSLLLRLSEEYPNTNKGMSADVFPDSESSLHPVVREGFTAFLGLMFAVVAAILLLACANVAGLLLARSVSRRKEVSLRMALGASRGRLVRQLLSESLMLSALGGAAGLLLGFWLIRLVSALRPSTDIPLHVDAGLDWTVVAFTAAAAVATGFIFGLTPALAAVKQDLVSSLKEGGLMQTVATSRLRRLLVAGQISLSCLLLIGALLLVRSLQRVRELDLGFNPDHQLVAALDLELNRYDEARGRLFLETLKERLSTLPGVEAVGFAEVMPLSMYNQQAGALPEGYQPPPNAGNPSIDYNVVDEDYFQAMGIPILQGRGFTQSDGPDAPRVMVVNQAFVQRFWPGQNPLGKRIRRGPYDYQVVGVVKTGKYFSLGEDPKAYMYQSMRQLYQGSLNVHIRTSGDPAGLSNAVRDAVRALDETLPVSNLQTMNAAMGFALLPARLGAGAVSAFAILALFLASVGLYGMISYYVSQSSRDLAVRSAMGATPGDLIGLVLRQGAATILPGLVLGLLSAAAATRLMAGLLYGISATDPISFLAAGAALALVSAAAAFLPARKAAELDPITALREV